MPLDTDRLLRDEELIDKVARAIRRAANPLMTAIEDDYGFQPEARAAIEVVVTHIKNMLLPAR